MQEGGVKDNVFLALEKEMVRAATSPRMLKLEIERFPEQDNSDATGVTRLG